MNEQAPLSIWVLYKSNFNSMSGKGTKSVTSVPFTAVETTSKHDKRGRNWVNTKLLNRLPSTNEYQVQSKWIYCNWYTAIERSSSMMNGKTSSIHREIDRMLLIQAQFKSNCSNQFSNYNFFFYFYLYRSMISLHIRYQYNLFIRDHPLQWTRKKWSQCLMGSR